MYEWFMSERATNASMSGPILQTEALKLANFKASIGWLDKFKKWLDVSLETNKWWDE